MLISSSKQSMLETQVSRLPVVIQKIKDKMLQYQKDQTKLLVSSRDLSVAQSVVVIRIEKVYDYFALGYMVDRLRHTKIPITITYAALLDRSDDFSYDVDKTSDTPE